MNYDPAIGYAGIFDFYEPGSDGARISRPAILAIHGGAWRRANAREFRINPDSAAALGMQDLTMAPDPVMADYESMWK